MSKNPSPPNPGTAPPPVSDFWCRLKRLRPLDPSVNVLGFALVTLCLICCFVYLDYRPTVLKRFKSFSAPPERHYAWLQNDSASSAPVTETNRTVDFLAEGGGECDLFEGEWVWDDGYPLYESRNCRFMDGGFRCSENGRPDSFYTKWRWQPKDCNLPRFDAKLMLEKLRGKRLVFIGDSIGRNQWESLLCMLSSGVSDPESIYEVNGNPITKHKGYLVFKFNEFNCTIEYYRSPFLVPQTRPPKGIPRKIRTTLKLDQMDWNSGKWKDADILIFNTGHWWNYEKTIRSGCYFQEGSEVKMNMSTEHAYGRAIKTVWQWIHRELNPSKTQVFFRTYAPVHFRGGDWKNGGSCHLETFPEMGSSHMPPETWSQFKIVNDMVSSHARTSGEIELELLKITSMSSRRKDGHLSLYYLDNGPAPLHRQDCSHWCLPGVPDAWNELLYALILKREKQYSSMDL